MKGAVTVFIGNLPFNYGDSDIENIFKPFGEVSQKLTKQNSPNSQNSLDHCNRADSPLPVFLSIVGLTPVLPLMDRPSAQVASVTLVKQADGRSKGYAFVDMMEKEAGEKAIAELNGSDIDGRNLNVALGGDSK